MQSPLLVYERKIIEILHTLPPSAAEEVLDFALFVQSKWSEVDDLSLDDEASADEVVADEARWDAQFAASREKLRKLGRIARDNFYAGTSTDITIVNDELAPVEPEQ
jgi:hypothetical protein